MTHYTIRCIGFGEQQIESISAIVDLASSALIDDWTFTDSGESDVFLINMTSESGKQSFVSLKEELPDYRIILSAENGDENMQGYWFLTKKSMAPPSLRELTDLFNKIGTFLSQLAQEQKDEGGEKLETVSEAPETDIEDSSDEVVVTDTRKLLAKNYLFGLILQAEHDRLCRIISFKPTSILYISPEQNYYCFSGTESDLRALCLMSPKRLKIKKVSQSKLLKEEEKEENLVKMPLEALKTQAVILASQGRILDGHSPELDVTLNVLPDFEALPILTKYRNIAEYMASNSMNLYSVAENLHIPMSDIFEFYNVCYILNKITIDYDSAKQDITDNENTKTFSYFLKSFFKKF